LDLVKHSLNTTIESMEEDDKLSIVTFEHIADVVLVDTMMNKKGKNVALKIIDKLEPLWSTNLWDGLSKVKSFVMKKGLKIMEEDTDNEKIKNINLFTDGLPK
jgi:hypothetical protein